MNRNNNPNQLVSVSSGQYMGVRDSLSNSVPYATKDTGRMILHDGNQAVYQQPVDPRQFQTAGDDRNRHASLHNFSTEFHGHQNRKIGASTVTEAKPVSFYRELEPNKYLNAPDIEGARDVQVIEKHAERLVEVMHLQPVEKPVERLFETIQIQDQQAVHELNLTCVVPEIVEVHKPVHYDREVLKENIQEIYVDKVVERVVEVLREVYVDKVVQRRIEVLKEVPTIRYVDRIITREVPIVQVVERVVEILKEVPIEVVKEVPVYVRTDVSDVEQHNRQKGQVPVSGNYGASNGTYGDNAAMYSSAAAGAAASSAKSSGRAGVGLVLERVYEGSSFSIFVRKLVQGSPAATSGKIAVNDKLISIDNKNIGDMALDKVFEMINGAAGSTLTMKLEKSGSPYDVILTRGQAKQ